MEIKVYHLKVLRKVKTEVGADLQVRNITSTDVIKCVGEIEMEQFIGYDEKRDKSGNLTRVPKKKYYRQLGYMGATCVKVTDRKGNPVKSEQEDIARINALLNPGGEKSAAQTLEEKFEALAADNARLKAMLEAKQLTAKAIEPQSPAQAKEESPKKETAPKQKGRKKRY